MLKKICIAVVAGLLFFNVAFAQNSTATEQDLLAIIKQLQAQIQSLQAQIADLKAEVQSVKLELKFSRSLAQGATGEDVKQLQEFLKTLAGSYPDGSITGYFGPRTEAAVKKFQEQNGIASVGVVGPKTQEKLNVLAAAIPAATPCINCSPTTTTPMPIPATQTTPAISPSGTGVPATSAIPAIPATPCKTPSSVQVPFTPTVIKVLSPNGGEQWQIGGTYTIKYSAKDIVGNKALLIYLNKGYDAPTTKTGVNSSQLIGVTTNLESYTYTVPNNIQAWPGLGSNYTISIYVEGSYSSCDVISYIGDFSDAEFSIVAGQGNAPVATPTVSVSTAIMPASGGGYGQEDKISALSAQIINLQEKLNSTTDTATRDSLVAQITALKAQVQALVAVRQSQVPQSQIQILYAQQSALIKQFNSTTDTAARSALWAQMTAVGEQVQALTKTPTTQEQINSLLGEIAAYQNKLNNTTDAAARDSLTAQITALKARIQILESSPAMPTVQPAAPTLSGTASAPVPMQGTSVSVQIAPANQDKINSLFEQTTALQNQLNSTVDTAKRDSLVAQIVLLKAQVTALQINSATISATQGMTTTGGGVQPIQDKPTDTQMPEISVSAPTTPTSHAIPAAQSPSIKVLSPNGGETLTIGKIYEIKWTGGNNTVDVYLLDNPTRLGKKIFSGITNNNYVSWVATPLSSSDLSNYATPSGQYIILVNCTDGNCVVDFSDSYFKIVE